MASRVDHDPYVRLRLVVGHTRTSFDRPRDGCVEVVRSEVDVQHHLLLTRPWRPRGGLIFGRTLNLDLEPVRRLQQRPAAGRALDNWPSEEALVERREVESVFASARIENGPSQSYHRSLHRFHESTDCPFTASARTRMGR
jgi:hypothetical protein